MRTSDRALRSAHFGRMILGANNVIQLAKDVTQLPLSIKESSLLLSYSIINLTVDILYQILIENSRILI